MRNVGVYYYEKQREKWLTWLVMTVLNLLFIIGCIVQIGFGRPVGQNPMSDVGLIIRAAAMFLISSLILSGNLRTYINSEGVFFRYSPYHFRYQFYAWNNISRIYVRHYHPIREYGGRGMRMPRWHFTGKTVYFNRSIAYTIGGKPDYRLN